MPTIDSSIESRLTNKSARGFAHKSQRGSEESGLIKWILIAVSLGFVGVFLVLPLVNVFYQALQYGIGFYFDSIKEPETVSAIRLTLLMTLIVVPMNVIFGITAAWAVAKFEFRGKAFLITLIDLPFAISPVVAGLMFVVWFGRQGFLGDWLDAHDLKVIFAVPGMVLVTMFVTSPFVARELIPLMQANGTEQEQAALTLGASGWQTFWHVTMPSSKWGLIYGIILCNARAMGEFGAVSVVSGAIAGQTETLPLRVDKLFHSATAAAGVAAFAVASLLVLLALLTLVIKRYLEWRSEHADAVARIEEQDVITPTAD